MTKRITLALVILVVIASTGFSSLELQRKSLQGLKGVFILVEHIEPEAERDGVRASDLQKRVEANLRLAGIKVLTEEELHRSPGQPFLYVRVTYRKLMTNIPIGAAIDLELELRQNAFLERDAAIDLPASTWQGGMLVTVGIGDLTKGLLNGIDHLTEQFISDYRSVNPK